MPRVGACARDEAAQHAALLHADHGERPLGDRAVHEAQHARGFLGQGLGSAHARRARQLGLDAVGQGIAPVPLARLHDLARAGGGPRPPARAARSRCSASRSTPVSTPIAWRQWTRSSVQTLPEAPGAKGQPPSPPMDASKQVTPVLHGGQDVRDGHRARVVRVQRPLDAREARARGARGRGSTWAGLAMPVVSASPMPRAPMSTSAFTTSSSRASGTSVSKGQPKEQEMPEYTGTPARWATSMVARSFAERLRDRHVHVGEVVALARRQHGVDHVHARVHRAHRALVVGHQRGVARAGPARDRAP